MRPVGEGLDNFLIECGWELVSWGKKNDRVGMPANAMFRAKKGLLSQNAFVFGCGRERGHVHTGTPLSSLTNAYNKVAPPLCFIAGALAASWQ